jgi:hypothetical protein
MPHGTGGEEVLEQWLGWRSGHDFELYRGGLVRLTVSKL